MYDLTIEREFCAAHAIVIGDLRETTHGHNWRVTVVVEGEELDADGLLCDFHVLERRLDDTLRPFQNADLNHTPPFDDLNPTAEHVARYIVLQMAQQMTKDKAVRESGSVRLRSVTVTEAPGCRATYRMDES